MTATQASATWLGLAAYWRESASFWASGLWPRRHRYCVTAARKCLTEARYARTRELTPACYAAEPCDECFDAEEVAPIERW